MREFFLTICGLCVSIVLIGCSASGGPQLKRDDSQVDIAAIAAKPLPPEKAEQMLGEIGENWLYGEGIGETAITVGTCVVFPPYILWVVGNGVLSLSGYQPLQFSDALPQAQGEAWREAYQTVASGPGRLAAAIAGKEYRSQEIAKDNLMKYMPPTEAESEIQKAAQPIKTDSSLVLAKAH